MTKARQILPIGGLFAPLRRTIQGRVDRRFNRTRFDAARILERYSKQLRQSTDLASLGGDLSAVTGQILEPVHVSLWLRQRP